MFVDLHVGTITEQVTDHRWTACLLSVDVTNALLILKEEDLKDLTGCSNNTVTIGNFL